MSYLITGGTGFIGSYIVRELVRSGERVVAYDLLPNTDLHEKILSKQEREQIEIVQGDVNDLAQLIRTAKNYGIRKIIHMAYILTNDTAANPPLAIKVNIVGTNNVFETARILEMDKVVWASSVSIYGPWNLYEEEYLPNDAPHRPKIFYGACKSFNERMAEHYYENFGLDSIGIRFGWTYGAGQRGTGASVRITRELMEKPALGSDGKVPDGDGFINWLYVEDAARAVVLACKSRDTKVRAFNINGDIRSMKEAADYVLKLIPNANITLQPGESIQAFKFNVERIESELGFKPNWSMEDGMKQTINTIRQWNNLAPL